LGKTNLALAVLLTTCLAAGIWLAGRPDVVPALAEEPEASPQSQKYTGSVSCRECHEKFYKLWAPSHHGLAMQPYTPEFARAEIGGETGWVLERGPEGEKKYGIAYALGGKNVYYFLTTMERGCLQVLPVAYDVRRNAWYDAAGRGSL